MFAYETNACKSSVSFIFCGKERSFHFVNIPIIVIKPEASVECNFVTEAFFNTSLGCMAQARTCSERICENICNCAGRI